MRIKVDQFVGYKRTRAPDILDSGGLGPCVSVGAVYQEEGYMSHDTSPSDDTEGLDQLLMDLETDVTDKSQLKIFVGGGSTHPKFSREHNDQIRAGRQVVVDKINDAGFGDQIEEIKWGTPKISLGLSLDISEKRHEFDETLVPGHEDL